MKDSHSEQERPVMPAALAELLIEPGWVRVGVKLPHQTWRYDLPAGGCVYYRTGAHYPLASGWWAEPSGEGKLVPVDCKQAADLMRRIEAALARDAAPGVGEAAG